jgi:hypothetical protein
MSVTAVSAINSYTQDPGQQQNGWRQDLQSLQQALSAGSLTTAQQALSRFQQDLQGTRPQQSGVRASAAVNPRSTMRGDLQAMQDALDSGDLAMAEEAFVRIQQDGQLAAVASQGLAGEPARQPSGSLPKNEQAGDAGLSADAMQKSNGNLIDVTA